MEKLCKGKRSNSVGRFLLDVLKPTPALSTLGKRARGEESNGHTTRTTPASDAPDATTGPSARSACVALQNEDPFLDAVVITALDVVPFCCHADLITMSRTQILQVAAILNAKLPLAMQIDTDPSLPDVSIRHAIELLVGLRDEPPHIARTSTVVGYTVDSPTATPLRNSASPGTRLCPVSPPPSRDRPSMSFGSPSLAVLLEDSEEGRHPTAPPQKKRRTDAPITRAFSRRVAPFLAHAAALEKGGFPPAAAAASARMPLALTRPLTTSPMGGPTTATTSPRRGRGRGAKGHRFTMTSTPKKRAVAGVNSPEGGTRVFKSLLADIQNTSAETGGSPLRASMFSAKGGEESTVVHGDVEVTFGIDGMTIPIADAGDDSSDMDISV